MLRVALKYFAPFVFFVGISHANDDVSMLGVSCRQEGSNCTSSPHRNFADQIKAACYAKRMKCEQEIKKNSTLSGIDFSKYLIDCDHQQSCQIKDPSEILKGCSKILGDSYQDVKEKIGTHLDSIKENLKKCLKKSGRRISKQQARACLVEMFPDWHFPSISMDRLASFSQKKSRSIRNWVVFTKTEMDSRVQSECGNIHRSSDFQRCAFNAAMNTLLQSMETPYSETGLQAYVDRLTEVYVDNVAHFETRDSCFNAQGTGVHFCLVAAGIIGESIELAPVIKEEKILQQSIQNAFKDDLAGKAERRLLAQSGGRSFLFSEGTKTHVEAHLSSNTNRLLQEIQDLQDEYQGRLAVLNKKYPSNDHAKADMKLFLVSHSYRDVNSKAEVSSFVVKCLIEKSNECPEDHILGQYFQSLTPSGKEQVEANLLAKLEEKGLSEETKKNWRSTKSLTTVGNSEDLDRMLDIWEKDPSKLKITVGAGERADKVLVEMNRDGKIVRYEAIVCPEVSNGFPCKVQGETHLPNSIMSIYPLCGDGVIRVGKKSFQKLKEGPISTAAPCE